MEGGIGRERMWLRVGGGWLRAGEVWDRAGGGCTGCAKSSCPLYSLVISSSPLAQHWVCTTAEDRTLNANAYLIM